MNTANFMCIDYPLYSSEIDENLRTIIYNVFDYKLKPGHQTNNQKKNMDIIRSAYQKRTNVKSLLTLVENAIESHEDAVNITIDQLVSQTLYSFVTDQAIHLAGNKEGKNHVYREIFKFIKTNKTDGFSRKFEWIIQFAIMFNVMKIIHEISGNSSLSEEIRKYKKRVKFMSHAENTAIIKHVKKFTENEKKSQLANIDSNLPTTIQTISLVSEYITTEIESLQKMKERTGSLPLPVRIETRLQELAADIFTEDPSQTTLQDITVNILRYWVAAKIMIHSEQTHQTTDIFGSQAVRTHTDNGPPIQYYDIDRYITALKLIIRKLPMST
jgi:hypothetical protein